MVYMLAASLYFVLVSQFVGEHHGRSKKRRLSPEASPAAEELLNVTRDHSDARERRESKRRTVKKNKIKDRNRETVTESNKEGLMVG